MANQASKSAADEHKYFQTFSEEGLVMVHLHKECFLNGTSNKLKSKKIGPIRMLKKIGDNVYVLDLHANINFSPTFNVYDLYTHFPPNVTLITRHLKSIFLPIERS